MTDDIQKLHPLGLWFKILMQICVIFSPRTKRKRKEGHAFLNLNLLAGIGKASTSKWWGGITDDKTKETWSSLLFLFLDLVPQHHSCKTQYTKFVFVLSWSSWNWSKHMLLNLRLFSRERRGPVGKLAAVGRSTTVEGPNSFPITTTTGPSPMPCLGMSTSNSFFIFAKH